MGEVAATERPPLGIRLMNALGKEPDWLTMTAGQLVALRDAVNRKRSSRLARLITGFPDRGATIRWQEVALPGRSLRVRVYRPSAGQADLPLVLHVHGGGFVGTAVQSDWVNSHLAARLPAVVVSVEHRLLDQETPLSAAVDDGWDVLRHVVRHAGQWGADPARVAVFGESTGSLVTALAAVRARESGLPLRAQVLVNAAVRRPRRAGPGARGGADHRSGGRPRPLLRRATAGGRDARAAHRISGSDARVPQHAGRRASGEGRAGGDRRVPSRGLRRVMDPRPANEDPGAASPATVLADRIGERARSGEFVVFGGSALRDGESAGDPDQWAAVKAGHLARAAELARSL